MLFIAWQYAIAKDGEDSTQLLKQADAIKISKPGEFTAIVKRLKDRESELTPAQQASLHYLEGWHRAYGGDYEGAITVLNGVIRESKDTTLQFRARATIINVLSLSKRYEDALSHLTHLLELLPTITDPDARAQGLAVTSRLYIQDGQFDTALGYAQMLIDENWASAGTCSGGQMKLEALYRSGKLRSVGPEFQTAIGSCLKLDELLRANLIRTYAARIHMANGRLDEAIRLLQAHYEEVLEAKYPTLLSQYDALLAQSYRESGDTALARQYALRAVDNAVPNEYTEPLVAGYRLLYLLAKEQGDTKAALTYHERYTTADKGHLNNESARQLAFQRVKHQVDASKLQIEALNKQNEVLQLQRSLADKAVENSRLYIILLVMGLAFVVLMAYRMKRSQMHFRNLSRLDGLTGIFNRPHFIELTEHALQESSTTGQGMCIIVCDLDHFKKINDTCGHAAGDAVLKKTAQVFQEQLRKVDIVGRLGGEEFGIALVDCDAATARARCEQVRAALAAMAIASVNMEFALTASFGIATTTTSGHELRQLLAHADIALYQAKRTGRNRVVQYDDPAESSSPETAAERLSA